MIKLRNVGGLKIGNLANLGSLTFNILRYYNTRQRQMNAFQIKYKQFNSYFFKIQGAKYIFL